MANFYISGGDLPDAKVSPDARLYAGRGWLSLAREAMAIIGDSEIMAIREDAGALRIELARATPEQRSVLREIERRSLHICEICGDPGELRYDGLKSGQPVGWHRTRCAKHLNTKTLAAGKPPLLNHIATASSGLFIHGPARIALSIADALRAADKVVATLSEADSMELAIEQIADQLGVPPSHTISATLETASARLPAPIYLLVEHAERFENSEIIYALKAARDALNSSKFFGLRVAFVGADLAVLQRMRKLPGAAFFCAEMRISSSAERSVFDLAEREQIRRHALRIAFSSWSRADERMAALEDLALVVEHDEKFPLGTAAHLSTEKIRDLVPAIVRDGHIPYVRDADIPEPWLTRFGIASIGSTRVLAGAYVHDWENFLSLWDQEHARLTDALEDLEDA